MSEMSVLSSQSNTLPSTVVGRRRQILKSALIDYCRSPEFKRLVSQIQKRQDSEGFSSCAVLSEFPGEGRSFFTTAIAIGYAILLGKKALILDIVRQTANRTLYLERLLGGDPSNLSVMSSGGISGCVDLMSTNNEGGLSESSDFQVGKYIDNLKSRYDLILVDTCALNVKNMPGLMDPIIISTQTDSSILVTSDLSLTRDIITRIKKELDSYSVNLTGTVYNAGVKLK